MDDDDKQDQHNVIVHTIDGEEYGVAVDPRYDLEGWEEFTGRLLSEGMIAKHAGGWHTVVLPDAIARISLRVDSPEGLN